MKQKLNQFAGNIQSINQKKLKNVFKSQTNHQKPSANDSSDQIEATESTHPTDIPGTEMPPSSDMASNSNSKYQLDTDNPYGEPDD